MLEELDELEEIDPDQLVHYDKDGNEINIKEARLEISIKAEMKNIQKEMDEALSTPFI